MKAVCYARQSGGDSDESLSVDTQIEKCCEVCAKNGWEVVGVFSDLNTSGRTYPTGAEEIAKNDSAYQEWYRSQTKAKKFRDGLGKALDAEKDIIVLYDETRLMRPWADTFLESYIRQRLKGTRVFTVKEGEIRLDQFTGRLVNSITNSVEDNQLQTNKRKAKEALDRLKSQGERAHGREMYGYRYSKDLRMLVALPCLDEVREAYRMLLAGDSHTAICRRLNASGNRRWSLKILRKTLALPVYAGLMWWQGKLRRLKDGQISEPAVSEEDWYRARRLLEDGRRPSHQRRYVYALSGLVRCGYCKSVMRIVRSTAFQGPGSPRGEDVHSYNCSSGAEDDATRLDCSLARIRYSFREPARVEDERPFQPSYDGLAGRFARTMAQGGATFPELRFTGLYEALMPLLYSIAMRDSQGGEFVEADRERMLMIEGLIAEQRNRRLEQRNLQRDGLITYDELRDELRVITARLKDLEQERQGILEKLARTGRDALQLAANRLMDIRTGSLHPDDLRELFLRDYDRVEAYSSQVVIYRKDGKMIRLQKISSTNCAGLPPAILEHDGRMTKVTYLNKSAWKAIRHDEDGEAFLDAERHLIYEDAEMQVYEAGENPVPGDGSGKKRISERTKRRRELWLEEQAVWKDD